MKPNNDSPSNVWRRQHNPSARALPCLCNSSAPSCACARSGGKVLGGWLPHWHGCAQIFTNSDYLCCGCTGGVLPTCGTHKFFVFRWSRLPIRSPVHGACNEGSTTPPHWFQWSCTPTSFIERMQCAVFGDLCAAHLLPHFQLPLPFPSFALPYRSAPEGRLQMPPVPDRSRHPWRLFASLWPLF